MNPPDLTGANSHRPCNFHNAVFLGLAVITVLDLQCVILLALNELRIDLNRKAA